MDEHFSIALICASKGRYENLAYRIPIWAKAGFDEVIIVGKYRGKEKDNLEKICIENNAKYIPESDLYKDTRSLARNLGAKTATTEWIVFADDDDDIIGELDISTLAESTRGKDWVVGRTGDIIVYHRRGSFLSFGGYPEDMVSAEDIIMSNRARLNGIGGFEGEIYKKIYPAPNIPLSKTYNLTRALNSFWYGFTFFILVLRTPQPKKTLIGEMRRNGQMMKAVLKGQPKNSVFFIMRVLGLSLSVFHVLGILAKSGRSALKREPLGSWQGLR